MKRMIPFGLLILCMLILLCAPAIAAGAAIEGCAYVDANENAICDAGEQLMTGVAVTLQTLADGQWSEAGQAVTDAYGAYTFTDLEAGEYRVLCSVNDASFYAATIGASGQFVDGNVCLDGLALTADAPAVAADIGLRTPALLSAAVYLDANGNGERGAYEEGLKNVKIEVLNGDDVLAWGMTGKKGTLSLAVAPGSHALRATLPEGYGFTVPGKHSLIGDTGTSLGLSEALSFTTSAETSALIAARQVGSFSGKAFEDMNNNGVMDEGEPGVAGVTVYLVGQKSGTRREITTDESGLYVFDMLPDDKYTVTASLPDGMLYARYSAKGGDLRSIFTGETLEREFSVRKAAKVTDKNIGVVQKGAIHGTAFYDLNYNGLWDEGEPGYEGVTLEAIKLSNGDSLGKCVTGKDGSFRLENLRGGDYRLRAILPEDGSIFTVTGVGTPDQVNLFAQRNNRRESSIEPINIESGGESEALVGVARGASVSGTVFEDADYNGAKNGKEKALSGVKVQVVDLAGNVVAAATTTNKGEYILKGIMPGSYIVQVQRKNDFGFTRLRPAEKGGSHIMQLVGQWGETDVMTIAMGEAVSGVNAGMLPSATVSGSFFHDTNDNGLWDDGELGMLSAKVRLTSSDGEIDLFQTPAEDGSYFFDGVMPGKYTMTYILPEHCEMARTVQNGNTVAHAGLETASAPFDVKMGAEVERPLAGAVTLGSFEGFVFNDSNANGIPDAGEDRLSGATIALKGNGGQTEESVSADDGSFSIVALRPDDYTLSVELPEGFIFSSELSALAFQPVSAQTLSCSWQTLIGRGSMEVGAVRPASISGVIWMDEDQNGTQAEGEWIMEGVGLVLVDESTGADVASAVSAAYGFCFENVRPGTYTVSFVLPDQSSPAADSASTFTLNGSAMVQSGVAVSEGQQLDGLTTGLVSRTSIGGWAWLDENGQRSPVAGITVTLYANGAELQRQQTGEDGSYRFDGLWPDSYTLSADLPDGMIFVRPDDPNYETGASFVSASADGLGTSEAFPLLMAQHQLEKNVLLIKPARVGDIAWLDENGNGLVDGGERRIPGVKVALTQNGQPVYEVVTDEYGYYLLDDVYPGEYTIQASAYAALTPTTPVPQLRLISSCLVSGDGLLAQSEAFRVESGETNANFDLGYILQSGQPVPEAILQEGSGRDWTISHLPKE